MTDPHRSATSLPPAGWYADPSGSDQERYWEGTRWTKNLRDRPEVPEWLAARQTSELDDPRETGNRDGQPTTGPLGSAAPPEGWQGPPPGSTWPPPPGGRPLPPGRPQGQFPQGQFPQGQFPQGQFPQGQFPPGQFPQGQFPQGPHGQIPPGYRLAAAPAATRPVVLTSDGVPLAAYWQRVVATLIDAAITSGLGMLVSWRYVRRAWRGAVELFGWSMDHPGQMANPDQFDYGMPVTIVGIIISLVAFAMQVPLVRLVGGTLGQLVMGLRVVPTGRGRDLRSSWWTSLLRSAAWLAIQSVSFSVVLPMLVNYLRPLWHPRRQTWHDSIARTQVVTVRGPAARRAITNIRPVDTGPSRGAGR